MSIEWYENDDWSEEAQHIFVTKIARARNQKPHYLWRKAQAIAPKHPDSAESLFARALDCGDELETIRAFQARAAARIARGEIDRGVDDLIACADFQQESATWVFSTCAWDLALHAGVNRRAAYYDAALKILGPPSGIPESAFAAHAGMAFIYYDRGDLEAASQAAKMALRRATMTGEVAPGIPVARIAPFPDPLYDRLLVIANLWDEAKLGQQPAIWPTD